MRIYATYAFKDKDPVIDWLRTYFEKHDLKIIEVAHIARVHPRTIYNWFYGPTMRPYHPTLACVLRAIGLQPAIIDPVSKAVLWEPPTSMTLAKTKGNVLQLSDYRAA